MRKSAQFSLLTLSVYLLLLRVPNAMGWKCDDGVDIPDEFRCDDKLDCKDRSDELQKNCPDRVCDGKTQFQCKVNGRCIDKSFVCNGESDCLYGDHSDESEDCTISEPDFSIGTESASGCSGEMFKCSTIEHCIPAKWKCDGERDCLDASDEFQCGCFDSTFGCYVRGMPLCLRHSTMCDGIKHCDDGEDEANCTSTKPRSTNICASGLYSCRATDECLQWNMVCDGIADCGDGSDEEGLCHVNDCGHDVPETPLVRKVCEHQCHESPDGAQCLCEDGFRLASDGVHCFDEDECAEMLSAELHNSKKLTRLYDYGLKQVCSQTCVNLPGGFHCSCEEGYILEFDAYTCIALGSFTPEMYIVIGSEIHVFSLQDSGHRGLQYHSIYKGDDSRQSIADMDVSIALSTIFWIGEKSGKLKMKSDHGIATIKLGFVPVAVSVDWVSGNLLVATKRKDPDSSLTSPAVFLVGVKEKILVDQSKNKIIIPNVIELISGKLENPVSIAAYPQKGILLIADRGSSSTGTGAQILAANMDGSEVRTVVSENLVSPVDVIVDDVHEAVIWASCNKDSGEAVVESIRLDGTQRGVIMSRKANGFPVEPVSIAVFEGHLYVSDRRAREVRSWETNKISLYGNQNTLYGSESVIKLEDRADLGTIKIVHPVLQRPLIGRNHCKTAGCSHACVMVPKSNLRTNELGLQSRLGPICLCPSNHKLLNDGKSCMELSLSKNVTTVKLISTALPTTAVFSTALTHLSVTTATSDATTAISANPRILKTWSEKLSIAAITLASTAATVDAPTSVTVTTAFAPATRPTVWATTTLSMAYSATGRTFPMPTCVYPPEIENSVMSSSAARLTGRFETGQTVSYSCLAGYVMEDVAPNNHAMVFKITCLSNGTWSLRLPTCVPAVRATSETTLTSRHGTSCGISRCGNWSRCKKNANGDHECPCLYGESTSRANKCLPPQSTIAATASPWQQSSQLSARIPPPPVSSSTIVLIVTAVLFLILMSILCSRCMRKKRYSIDLRYFCSGNIKPASTPQYSRENVLYKPCESSFTANPSYTSSRQLKSIGNEDDKSDSGILPSFCSNSLSSFPSEERFNCGEGNFVSTPECERDQQTSSSLLLNEEACQDDVSVCGLMVGDAERAGKLDLLSGRLGNIFKIRKTESRECMLPKRKSSAKLSIV